MRCRKLCIARRSGKESPHRHGPGQALRCCGHWNPAEDSSPLPFYGGAPTPAVFARGMKNSIAAGGCMAANFLRRARGEASSICFISEAAASREVETKDVRVFRVGIFFVARSGIFRCHEQDFPGTLLLKQFLRRSLIARKANQGALRAASNFER